jgi:hypothetical protein
MLAAAFSSSVTRGARENPQAEEAAESVLASLGISVGVSGIVPN